MEASRSILMIALTLVSAACHKEQSPAPTQVQSQGTPREVSLRVGETAVVNNVPIRFSGVLEDSRCPSDVQCIWAGNAQVALGVGPPEGTQGPTERVVLNTNTGAGADSAASWGLRLRMIEVTPVPRSTQPIPPEGYVIRVKVEDLGP